MVEIIQTSPDERQASSIAAAHSRPIITEAAVVHRDLEAEDDDGFFVDTAEAFGAAFVYDNAVISGVQELHYDIQGGADIDGFNPYRYVLETWDSERLDDFDTDLRMGLFDNTRSPDQVEARAAEITAERARLATMDQSTLGALSGSLVTAFFDLTSYIPVAGQINRLSRISNTGRRVAGFAGVGAAAAAVPEIALQATQDFRTLEESFLAVGTGALLGGGVGVFARAANPSSRLSPAHPENPLRAENDNKVGYASGDGDFDEIDVQSVGAARVVEGQSLEGGVLSRIPVIGKLVGDIHFNTGGPAARAFRWTGNKTRGIVALMMDPGGILSRQNRDGVAVISAEDIKRDYLRDREHLFQEGEKLLRNANRELAKLTRPEGVLKTIKGRLREAEFNALALKKLDDIWSENDTASLADRYGTEGAQVIDRAANDYAELIHKTNDQFAKRLKRAGVLRNDAEVTRLEGTLKGLKQERTTLRDQKKAAEDGETASNVNDRLDELEARISKVEKDLRFEKGKAPDLGREYGHAHLWDSSAILHDQAGFRAFLLDLMADRPHPEWLADEFGVTPDEFDKLGIEPVTVNGRQLDEAEGAELRAEIMHDWVGDERIWKYEMAKARKKQADIQIEQLRIDLAEVVQLVRLSRKAVAARTVQQARKFRDAYNAKLNVERAKRDELARERDALKTAAEAARRRVADRLGQFTPLKPDQKSVHPDALAQATKFVPWSKEADGTPSANGFLETTAATKALGAADPVAPEGVTRISSYLVSREAEDGYEHAVAVNVETGEVEGMTAKSADMVSPSKAVSDLMKTGDRVIDLHHNHPNDSPLSSPDVGSLGFPGMRTVVATTKSGAYSAVGLTDVMSDALKEMPLPTNVLLVRNIAMDVEKTAQTLTMGLFKAGLLPDAAARLDFSQNLMLRIMQEAGIIRYKSSVDLDAVLSQMPPKAVEAANAVVARKLEDINNVIRKQSPDLADQLPSAVGQRSRVDDFLEVVGQASHGPSRPEGSAGSSGSGAGAASTGRARLSPPPTDLLNKLVEKSPETIRAEARARQVARELKRAETRVRRMEQRLTEADTRLRAINEKLARAKSVRNRSKELAAHLREGARLARKELSQSRRAMKRAENREDLYDVADQIIANLTSGESIPALDQISDRLLKTASRTGRVKERTLRLDREHLKDALDKGYMRSDLGPILQAQYEKVSGYLGLVEGLDIGKGKTFESFQDVVRAVEGEYDKLIEATDNPKKKTTLEKERAAAVRDVTTLKDRLLGTEFMGVDRDSWTYWISSKARQANFLRYGSGFLIPSLTDIATVALTTGGLGKLISRHMMETIDIMRAYRREDPTGFDAFVSATEISGQGNRMARALDAEDTFRREGIGYGRTRQITSQVDKAGAYLSEKTNIFSGMRAWNRFWKIMSGVYMQSRVKELVARYDTISDVERAQLANLGIGREQAAQVHELMEKFGTRDEKGRFDPHLEEWTKTEAGRDAARRVRVAIQRTMDRAVLTPGIGDTPVLMGKWYFKMLLQFQTFAMSFANRFMVPAAQRIGTYRDAQAMAAFAHLAWSSAVVVALKDLQHGKDPTERFDGTTPLGDTMFDMVDRSGMMTWMSPYVDSFLKMPLDDGSMGEMIGMSPSSRYVRNRWQDSLLGASFGLYRDAAEMVSATGEGDLEQMRRKGMLLMPFGTFARMAHNLSTDNP